jgi:hypothetical protein
MRNDRAFMSGAPNVAPRSRHHDNSNAKQEVIVVI